MIQVNCRSDFRFQVDVETPNAAGNMATPAAGAVTGLLLRLSETEGGAALNPLVENLAAAETSGKAGRFYVEVDAALLTAHVLGTVGHRGEFYGVWSKAGDMDKKSIVYRAVDGEVQ